MKLLCGAVVDEEGELEPAKVKLVNSNAKINRRLTSDAVHSDSGSMYTQIAGLSSSLLFEESLDAVPVTEAHKDDSRGSRRQGGREARSTHKLGRRGPPSSPN